MLIILLIILSSIYIYIRIFFDLYCCKSPLNCLDRIIEIREIESFEKESEKGWIEQRIWCHEIFYLNLPPFFDIFASHFEDRSLILRRDE